MPPSSPWGKKSQPNNAPSAGFPGLKPSKQKDAVPKSQYEEIQEDELIALASIYGDDFRRIETTHTAWKKAEPNFEITIKSSDNDISVVLCVTLTATYPKTAPLLSLRDGHGLLEGTRFKIQKVIESKPKELVVEEQAMIMEIVNACLDILEDAAQAKAAGMEIPSLEEERAAHEVAAAKLADQQREEEERKKQMENLEEERMLGSLVQDELKRQKAKAKETKRKSRPPPTLIPQASIENGNFLGKDDSVTFDQPIHLTDVNGNPFVFQTVAGKVCIRQGPVSKCFTVRPIVSGTEASTLALKQTELATGAKDQNMFKKQLQLLEIDLKSLKEIRHQNVLDLLEFKVHKTEGDDKDTEGAWTVSILTEFAEKGTLEELLDITGSLGVTKVRSWTIELLDALRFLHEHGIVHEDIHTCNVLLVREPSGDVRPKLADASFQKKLHNLGGKKQSKDTLSVAKSAYWLPPETANTSQLQHTQKTDIWDFGIVFLQMAFGLSVIKKYSSPTALANSLPLSYSSNEFIGKLFKADPKKRPRAFELSSSEFLATDAELLDSETSAIGSRLGSIGSLSPVTPRRPRHDSMNTYSGPFSRYREDFVEEGRLGKGGFGEVVKARKKLDGQIYAIKKITQKSSTSLTEVLKEVRLLSQLSHPSVVRYYNTWTEEVLDSSETDDDLTTTDAAMTERSESEVSPGMGPDIEFGVSTGGLDFMSSSGYPQVEFGYDDASDAVYDSDESEELTSPNSQNLDVGVKHDNELVLKRSRSSSRYQRPFKTILYISMEYCEKRTLRDLIKRGLNKEVDEIWRVFRQILEGLAHIHGLNVVHRDLKPENVFIDSTSNVKIGDFGLATSGQYSISEKSSTLNTHPSSGDMTRSIGTAFYVAPEISFNVGGGSYTSKVDMYSLGIIFFEMCYRPLVPGMERAQISEGLRLKQPSLPKDFGFIEKAVQVDIIYSLLSHNPKERPSSTELLQGGKLPVQMESETIRRALAGMSDSASPYYHKMMSALFSMPNKQAKDFAWDMASVNHNTSDLLLQGLVKQKLISIFRHHGAVETPRSGLFPRSRHYGPNAVQLLDPNGTLLQLPYDLTLPHARSIAKHEPSVQRSFAFGPVFRDRQSGGQPQTFGEVDFDIVSPDSLDLALKEAEVIKVLDEIVTSFPALSSTQMCFHINHSDLLGLIFDYCRIEPSIRDAVSDALSKLNIQSWSWQKIKTELRSPLIGVSVTSVDDLQKFDLRDTPNKAFQKLKTIFEGTDNFEKASSAIAHLRDVLDYTKRFQVHSKIYVSPLGSLKEKFCKGGVIFSCLYDKKVKDVFAAGGRYDSLIREHRHRTGSTNNLDERHAVGFNLAWEKLARLPKVGPKGFMKKADEEIHGVWNTKRCDVLVASHDAAILRTSGIEIVQALWASDISAELAQDSRSPEDLLSKYRDDQHSWIVIIKQDSVLKVKSMARKEVADADISSSQLLAWIRGEIRERDQREGTNHRAKLQRHASQPDTSSGVDHEQDVRVLIAGTKSKKSNRRNIVEQAQAHAATLVQSFLDGPIAAIETTDHVLELIRDTKLSDPDSWRKVTHAVPTAERRYIGLGCAYITTSEHERMIFRCMEFEFSATGGQGMGGLDRKMHRKYHKGKCARNYCHRHPVSLSHPLYHHQTPYALPSSSYNQSSSNDTQTQNSPPHQMKALPSTSSPLQLSGPLAQGHPQVPPSQPPSTNSGPDSLKTTLQPGRQQHTRETFSYLRHPRQNNESLIEGNHSPRVQRNQRRVSPFPGDDFLPQVPTPPEAYTSIRGYWHRSNNMSSGSSESENSASSEEANASNQPVRRRGRVRSHGSKTNQPKYTTSRSRTSSPSVHELTEKDLKLDSMQLNDSLAILVQQDQILADAESVEEERSLETSTVGLETGGVRARMAKQKDRARSGGESRVNEHALLPAVCLWRNIYLAIQMPAYSIQKKETFLQKCEPHVKVAILDTGIDCSHEDIQDEKSRIERRSWLPLGEPDADEHGHGTHATSLILRIAPGAQLYVARIFKDRHDVHNHYRTMEVSVFLLLRKNWHNFTALGEAVPGAWPGNTEKLQWGTSTATPIAAAIAANIIEFSRQKPPLKNLSLKVQKLLHSFEGVSQIFRSMVQENEGPGNFVVSWNLFDRENGQEDVARKLFEELKKEGFGV
ncbi:hypothetical protein G7Y89_g1387 [Cudoniella acicularis]|uniref:non-specific serine/threonine protein kinase n=1 Tax=Cudoniella acicularis TaxID=354080 RepID=A0A8H4RY98_9HELO|nr:hypothetical protein G7Y89_g1387 [Cudoniella acicularis]